MGAGLDALREDLRGRDCVFFLERSGRAYYRAMSGDGELCVYFVARDGSPAFLTRDTVTGVTRQRERKERVDLTGKKYRASMGVEFAKRAGQIGWLRIPDELPHCPTWSVDIGDPRPGGTAAVLTASLAARSALFYRWQILVDGARVAGGVSGGGAMEAYALGWGGWFAEHGKKAAVAAVEQSTGWSAS